MKPRALFLDRLDAGRKLALAASKYRDHAPIVLALPRGGVPVAAPVAEALGAPLDVLVARKLGAPAYPELALGAIAEGGAVYLDIDLVLRFGVGEDDLERVAEGELRELDRRARLYRADRPAADVRDRTVIMVDDGLATGATARAAVRALRRRKPRAVVLAVPVGAPEAAEGLHAEADALVCLETPSDFSAVDRWYERFEATTDEEVLDTLSRAAARRLTGRPS